VSGVSRRRALVAAAAMGSAAALATLAKPSHIATPGEPTINLDALFPKRFGAWHLDGGFSSFVRPPTTEGKVYGLYDQVLERVYVDGTGQTMMLSVAYGREQSAGMQLHRPEVCYRFGGFEVKNVHSARLTLADRTMPVTRLLASKPGRNEPLTYWATLGDELVQGRIAFRLRQLSLGLQRQLLDGLLLRVSSIDDDTPGAYARQARFSEALVQAVPAAWRGKVIGKSIVADQSAG